MSAKYTCPAQIRKNVHPFLMCALERKEGVDYNLRENAYKIACAHQHYCPQTKRVENTDKCSACYAAKMAAVEDSKSLKEADNDETNDAITETGEETEIKSEKTTRKKAKN